MTDMILTDLQKAFDRIDHEVLLQNLYAISSSKHTVNCFKSYLSNIFFLVNLGNYFWTCTCILQYTPSFYFGLLFLKNVSMTLRKLLNIIFSSMSMIYILFVNIKILKLEYYFLCSSPKENSSRIMKNGF